MARWLAEDECTQYVDDLAQKTRSPQRIPGLWVLTPTILIPSVPFGFMPVANHITKRKVMMGLPTTTKVLLLSKD